MKKNIISCLLFLLLPISAIGNNNDASNKNIAAKVSQEIAKGNLIARVTDVDEFKGLFGPTVKEESLPDGGGIFVRLTYSDNFSAAFKQMTKDAPITLLFISVNGENIDLGKPILRTVNDLLKLDKFLGLEGVSLVKLDLRKQKELITNMSFDSLTEWPPANKLPPGFEPKKILADGKNPGLGVRQLHKQGINGKDVGIAIIDQPLLQGHKEYVSNLFYYKALGVDGVSPQMHGPSVASFAVGKDIGTAPMATLYYFAQPSWIPDNKYSIEALQTIIELNKKAPDSKKIRVVSISSGMFDQYKNFDKWQHVLRQAEEENILVITCDPVSINFGNLTRILDKDPDSPKSYISEIWDNLEHPLWVPGGNRTRASYKGETVYAFDIVGGRSWSTPYLAGVAALGYQINPKLTPAAVKKLLIKSATPTKYGPIINPKGFIEMIKQSAKK